MSTIENRHYAFHSNQQEKTFFIDDLSDRLYVRHQQLREQFSNAFQQLIDPPF